MGRRSRVFSLVDTAEMVRHLAGIDLVVNLAGPFEMTQKPLIDASLAVGCHYIDIAGEVDEMRVAHAFDAEARGAGITIMPGAGFGVVPTDIAAKLAAEKLPDADSLEICYATEGGASRGTLKTVLGGIDRAGVRRRGGALVLARPAEAERAFTVEGKRFVAVTNPWRADLVTAGISTGIADIDTYSVFPGLVTQMMKGRFLWLRHLILNRFLGWFPQGPSPKQIRKGRTYVWATAHKGDQSETVAFSGPEAYRFTAHGVLAIARRILAGAHPPGFQTPSIYGKPLLDEILSVERGG
jgi:short subunit dehydrogenase-like uncharacterized protein